MLCLLLALQQQPALLCASSLPHYCVGASAGAAEAEQQAHHHAPSPAPTLLGKPSCPPTAAAGIDDGMPSQQRAAAAPAPDASSPGGLTHCCLGMYQKKE